MPGKDRMVGTVSNNSGPEKASRSAFPKEVAGRPGALLAGWSGRVVGGIGT